MIDLHQLLVQNVVAVELALYVAVLVGIWTAEALITAVPTRGVGRKWQHTRTNFMFVATALPIQSFMTTWVVGAAAIATQRHWGFVNHLPFLGEQGSTELWAAHPWLKIVLLFFMMDLCEYTYHRAMHAVPWLWRFHMAHHSDRAVDVSTTVREHPGESLFRNGMMVVWVLLCGTTWEVLVLRQAVMSVVNLTAHSSFRFPQGIARYIQLLVVTPNFHHVHHHFRLPQTDSNFGDVFTLWDRIFGTYSGYPAAEVAYGVDTHYALEHNARFIDVMLMPFRPKPSLAPEAPTPAEVPS